MSSPLKIFSIQNVERRMFFEAFKSLLLSTWANLVFPLKKNSKKWGIHQAESSFAEDIENKATIRLIDLSIRRAQRMLPFRAKCLAEAVAAKQMLDQRGIKSTLYLGVSKDDKKKLIAHAWLRAGNFIVTGKKGMEKFVEVGRFS
jgi:hypothetical protein